MAIEYISKTDAIHVARYAGKTGKDVSGYIESLPTADVVPVVRCADCVYCNTDRTNYPGNNWDGSCDYWNTHSVDFSWFCSQGKRKEAGA
jgi:hypothetical protein